MDKLLKLGNNFDKITGELLYDLMHKVIEETKDQWIAAVKSQVKDHGIREDGKKMTPGYSDPYKKKKKALGKYSGHVNLDLTGELHENWTVIFHNDGFEVMTERFNGSYNVVAYLFDKYGDFMGVTDKNRASIIKAIMPIIQERLKKVLNV